MDRIKEELRKVALDRLRPLHRHPVAQGVAAASIPVRAAQRGVARDGWGSINGFNMVVWKRVIPK